MIRGEKAYIATICANHCIFGASIAEKADETELTKAYGVFKIDTQEIQTDYAPKTVTTDGWPATRLENTVFIYFFNTLFFG